jgi:type II secretory pathway pseudopilin PulG
MRTGRDATICRARDTAGFTLIEAAVVLLIVAVVVGALTPSVVRQLSRARTNRAATVVAATFYQAQTTAGRGRSPVIIQFNTSAMTMTMTETSSGSVLRTQQFGPDSDFKLTTFTASPATVTILPTGMASSSVTVSVGGGGLSRQVLLTRAGMIRIQ